MSAVDLGDVAQLSGTAVASNENLLQHRIVSGDSLMHSPSVNSESSLPGAEQALETHEVVELQTFSERKVWIEEKIKFLEKMPPIEVFAGLDAVRISAEHVPGVPTPEELKHWIAEHDAIEKETEIFDRGELTKLRQLTKAATQRNLSPADTDVIELTLTTIYELDKLLHLLRDRSENLELLAIRLAWEESRIAAWVDRRKILEDIQTFLDNRVRWTPSVYEHAGLRDEAPGLQRRGSVASLASASSDASTTSAGFSRGARFKLGELLSRDAAQFAGRVTGLRHGKITSTGKILDKLIDQSPRPVPEELLDEQDRLEEKGITDMENLGKFVLNMVIQWRKADEIYVETMKDKTTAQNLFEEIETAKLHHPTARQAASFVSRADTLMKRLAFRGNPASSASTFPFPEHPLFSKQKDFNKTLAQSLSSDILATYAVAHKVEEAAKAYRSAFEAVKHVENLSASARELSATLTGILARLQDGIADAEGDGSPPNLSSTTCLESKHHSAFVTLFTFILEQFTHTADSSASVLRQSVPAIVGLNHPGIDKEFTDRSLSDFRELELLQNQAQEACETLKLRCDGLKEARRLHGVIIGISESLSDIQGRISESIEAQRWQRVARLPGEPLTTGPAILPSTSGMTPMELTEETLHIGSQITQVLDPPLLLLCNSLEDPLKSWFLQQSSGLKESLDEITKQTKLLDLIQRQTKVMQVVHEEFSNIQLAIENQKNQVEARTQEVLSDCLMNGSVPAVDFELHATLKIMQDQVERYTNSLSDRVPFVSQRPSTCCSPTSSSSQLEIHPSKSLDQLFCLPALDEAVRADSNSFAIRLSVQVEDLSRHLSRFRFAHLAKELDGILISTTANIAQLGEKLITTESSLSVTASKAEDITVALDTLLQDVEKAIQFASIEIGHSFSTMQDLLQKMDTASHNTSPEVLHVPRRQAVDDVASVFEIWKRKASALMEEICQEHRIEVERLERLRIAEEHHRKDCIAAEETGRLRIEQKRFDETLEMLEQENRAGALQHHGNKILDLELSEQAWLEKAQTGEEETTESFRQPMDDGRFTTEFIEKVRPEQGDEIDEGRHFEDEGKHITEKSIAAKLSKGNDQIPVNAEWGCQRVDIESHPLGAKRIAGEILQFEDELLITEEAGRVIQQRAKSITKIENPDPDGTNLGDSDSPQSRPLLVVDQPVVEAAGSQQQEVRDVIDPALQQRGLELAENDLRFQEERSLGETRIQEQTIQNCGTGEPSLSFPLQVDQARIDESESAVDQKRLAAQGGDEDSLQERPSKRYHLADEPLTPQHEPHSEQSAIATARLGPAILDKPRPLQGQAVLDHAQGENAEFEGQYIETGYWMDPDRVKSEQQKTAGSQTNHSPEGQRKHRSDRSGKYPSTPIGSSQTKIRPLVKQDVFGLLVAPENSSRTKEMHNLQAQVLAFRKRLRSMNINDIARPKKTPSFLPSLDQSKKMAREFSTIFSGVSLLPRSAPDPSVDVELRSLRAEIDDSAELMGRIEKLSQLADVVQKCDAALSDLLEHIDSYPASPKGNLSSTHAPLLDATPVEQLNARLTFTRSVVGNMTSKFSSVSTDSRAIAEKTRIGQTWIELEEMGHDRLGGRKSRPSSAVSSRPSSGRNSSASLNHARSSKKAGAYANLSVSSSAHQRLLLPRHPTPRRAVSGGSAEPQSRSVSQLSNLSSNRAVSGPQGMSVYGSTYASRQRTASNSHSTPVKSPSTTPIRTRAQTVQHSRVASPTGSEASYQSRSVRSHTRSSTSMSTWSRAPRNSFSSIAPALRSTTPKKRTVMPRKTYIADPKNKLDVAVGDVVNQLPIGINVEGVSETWRDQSGKYWIGNHDPKLCFCRILRSQTVMVRVGGGWSELSKFIKDHFADSFRLLPESPPRYGASEEKWISSTILLEAPNEISFPPIPPRTPEPVVPFTPSFSLSTPSGQSPRSLHSPSNSPSTKGSPLTPLQFMRRADVDNILRPGTPSKPPTTLRPRGTTQTHATGRNSIWRP